MKLDIRTRHRLGRLGGRVRLPTDLVVGGPVGRDRQERQNGMHALRHVYASVLLDAGESIKAPADYLSHSDPGFTLRTCTHRDAQQRGADAQGR